MLFFELLQVALGNRERLSRSPSDKEWEEIYDESGRQAVMGILLHGIDRLPAEQRPSQVLLFQWIGEGQMIELQNRVLDERCEVLLKKLEKYGLHGTILKGQGIAKLYNNLSDDLNLDDNQKFLRPAEQATKVERENSRIKSTSTDNKDNLGALRQPGDIDVCVDCGLKKALAFAKATGQKNVDWDYKHLHLNVWGDTEVEMHYRVEVLLNLWKNRRLQKWFKAHTDELFGHTDSTENTEISSKHELPLIGHELPIIASLNTIGTNNENTDKTDRTDRMTTPTVEFNVFYILLHIYRHFLYEGVGMRQIVDYYFVLKAVANTDGTNSTDYARETVSQFGMEKFAKGLMWVMKETLGMPSEWMLWEPDQKEGEYILKQVMKGGNFGHYDERLNHGGGKLGAVKAILTHNLHLLTHYPSDVIWAPVWIVWHKLWKIKTRMAL